MSKQNLKAWKVSVTKVPMIVSALVMVAIVGCGGNNSEQSTAPEAEVIPTVAAGLNGHWQSNCVAGGTTALMARSRIGVTSRSKLEVTEAGFHETVSVTSGACEGADMELVASGLAIRTSATLVGSNPIDLRVNAYRIKPVTEFGVRVLNLAKWCGIDDWSLDQERNVTDQVGNRNCFVTREVQTVYAIEDDKLYFGAIEASEIGRARPSEVKRDLTYTRL